MEEPRRRTFRADASEPRLGSAVGRSTSSERLLESPPSSHCMAAATGDEEVVLVFPNPQKPATVAYYREEEAITAPSHEKAVVVASLERLSSRTIVAAPWSYVGRLFSNKVRSVGYGGTSSQEVEEEKKGKQKKRWSWMPDPEKRWPVQGWS